MSGPWIVYELRLGHEERFTMWKHADWVPAVGDVYIEAGRKYRVLRRDLLVSRGMFHSGKLLVEFVGEDPHLERELTDAYWEFENG